MRSATKPSHNVYPLSPPMLGSGTDALENTKLQREESPLKYQHELLDIDHPIGKRTGALARDKILLDGNATAPAHRILGLLDGVFVTRIILQVLRG